LQEELAGRGFGGTLLIMQSNGGVMSVEDARRRPVATLMSGPVGGVAAATELLRTDPSLTNLVTLDIGGTSADVAILDEGEPVTQTLGEIASWPVMVPMVDVKSIGAGGGSIARVDPFGALLVGPESAGANPGPACYGRGGTAATVTDANLVLGRLDAGYFAGGDLELDTAAASAAIAEHVASPYSMSLEEAALGIVTVVNSTMARLLWEVMIGRGYDPREFALLAFGGAGPLHACALAHTLGIREVVVPVGPGTFSASGMIAADIRRDLERMLIGGGAVSDEELTAAYAELERLALAQIEAEHGGYERVDFRRFAELRYAGQHHPLSVEVSAATATRPTLEAAFHDKHHRLYGFRRDDVSVELLRIQISALGRVARVDGRRVGAGSRTVPEPIAVRRLCLDDGSYEASIFRRVDLSPGSTLTGPCVIEEPTSTTYLPPRFDLVVDEASNLRIEVPAAE
jgi:N-methylhydantoinase A